MRESEVQITNKTNTIVAVVSVVKNTKRNLLGMVKICKLNLLAIVNSICGEKLDFALDPYRNFPEIFDGLGTILGRFSK